MKARQGTDAPPRVALEIDGIVARPPKGAVVHQMNFEACEVDPEGAALLKALDEAGVEIVIHTTRPQEAKAATERWLAEKGLPFAVVVCGRPEATVNICSNSYPVGFWTKLDARPKGIKNLVNFLLTGSLD